MTQKEMAEKSFQRPSNYFELSGERQWEIDEDLGILDWDGSGLSGEDRERFLNYFNIKATKNSWNKEELRTFGLEVMNMGMDLRQQQLQGRTDKSGNDVFTEWFNKNY